MIASLERALSTASGANIDLDDLKTIVLFCGAGLLLSLVAAMTFGLNLGPDLL